jgi:hypothetical protein
MNSPLPEGVVKGFLNLVSDGALGIGNTVFQGNKMKLPGFKGKLGPPENKTDLGPVAMGNDHFIAELYKIGNVPCRLLYGRKLVVDLPAAFVFDQGVSTDGYHHSLCHDLKQVLLL